jgi:hypothetical protein
VAAAGQDGGGSLTGVTPHCASAPAHNAVERRVGGDRRQGFDRRADLYICSSIKR